MGNLERIREWRKAEGRKMSTLTLKQKVFYIRDYYGIWILISLSLLIFLIWFLIHSHTAVSGYWLYAAFPNAVNPVGDGSELWKDYAEASAFDLTEKNLIFNDSLYFDPTRAGGTNNSYYQMFVALIESGDLDIVCMRREELEALGKSGRLLDLQSDAAMGLSEKYRDRLVYSIPYDEDYSTEPVAVGIDVSDSLLMTEYRIYERSCVLALSAYTSRVPEAAAFLDWILDSKIGPVEQEILERETEDFER